MSESRSRTKKGTPFVSLVEVKAVFLETLKDTPKNRDKLHAKRALALAEGRDVSVTRTAQHPNDALFGKNRARRRWEGNATRRLLKRLAKRAPTPEQQQRVDEEVDKMFEDRETGERRTKSGIVLPKRESGRRGNR